MFYSQTFLARKGPLGTVWCAAHMQSRLKKSHYASTNIISTVDRIMFPEVPLALRMSSHLLLGVVRIYSKQVDFLYDDCNSFLIRLRKAFASVDLNLPEDARQAPVQAITLPETFDLDAMDLDDEFNLDKVDNHLMNLEDITLVDQIPFGTEPYICITFDDDFMMDASHPTEVPDSSPTTMDQNVIPPEAAPSGEGVPSPSISNERETVNFGIIGSENLDDAFKGPGPSNPAEMHDPSHRNDTSPQIIPDIEVMREAVPDFSVNSPLLHPNLGIDTAELQASLDKVMDETETISPTFENDLTPGELTLPVEQSSERRASVAPLQEDLVNNSPVSFAIRATPPVQKPKARPRKRKQYFDEAPVLTNRFMKRALEDPSDLLRQRSKIPCSALGRWKLQNNLRKENIFSEPSITGLSSDLGNLFNKDCMSIKLVSSEEAHPDTEVVRSPVPDTPAPPTEASPNCAAAELQTPMQDDFQETEILRHAISDDEGNTLPEAAPSSTMASSLGRDDLSPSTTQTLRSTSVSMTENDASTVFSGEHTGTRFSGLSDIPELNFEEEDDLFFLEADNTTPTASQGIHGIDSLSVRTRAVAQYLRRQSSATPSSEDQSGCLTLNKILKGKTRKLCARMFFETLVLKSSALVDMSQEEPYGDIRLRLTPALSKAQI